MRYSRITQEKLNYLPENVVNIRHNFVNLVSLSFERSEVAGRMKWWPPVTIHREKSYFLIKSEIPGFSSRDIKISVLDNFVTLESIDTDSDRLMKRYHRKNFKFRRTFELPEMIDAANVEATLKSGFLTLKLPILDASQEKIDVNFIESEHDGWLQKTS